MNWIEEVKNIVKIEEVVRRYCSVKNNSTMICCPFHLEKTPSMSINPNKNIFYCFGCGIGGDPIKFIQTIEQINFIDACKKIADYYGIEIHEKDHDSISCQTRLVNWYQSNLKYEIKALEYLSLRGLTNEIIAKFNLGWMSKDFRIFCTQNNITNQALENFGLKNNMIKIFENRIIFPIYSAKNQIIALGARAIENMKPKYINTADTHLFHKRETLYGIQFIKNNEPILLVEGYFDVLIAAKFGVKAVAPLGTSVSVDHLKQCLELTNNLIICMDGDVSGRASSNKILNLILSLIVPGKIVKFINLPNDEDPGSYIDEQKFYHNINNQVTLIDQLWNNSNLSNFHTPEEKTLVYQQIYIALDQVKDKELRFLYKHEIQKKWRNFNFNYIKKKDAQPKIITNYTICPKIIYESILMGAILYRPELFDDIFDYISNLALESPFFEFREFLVDNMGFNIKNYNEPLDKIDDNIISVIITVCSSSKIIKLAPFIQSPDNALNGWLEVYCFYIEYIGGLNYNE